VVADALSRLSMGSVSHVDDDKKELVQDVHRLAQLGVQLLDSTKSGVMVHNRSESSFVSDVKSKQGLDPILVELKEAVFKKSVEALSQGRDGVLRYKGRLCIPDVDNLRELVLSEAYSSWYSIHPVDTKCTMTCGKFIGGMGRRKISLNLWLSVLIVNKLRLSIKGREVYPKI